MPLLNIRLKNIGPFRDASIPFSFPKRPVHSTIDDECLEGFPNMRVKRCSIVSSPYRRTGSLLCRAIVTACDPELRADDFPEALEAGGEASISADFADGDMLYRITTTRVGHGLERKAYGRRIHRHRSYEWMASLLSSESGIPLAEALAHLPKTLFFHPGMRISTALFGNPDVAFDTLKAVIGIVEPRASVVRRDEGFEIGYGRHLFVLTDSAKTKASLDDWEVRIFAAVIVAAMLASTMTCERPLIVSDMALSCLDPNIEERIVLMMIGRLGCGGQLLHVTNDTGLLTVNLPKHSFLFLSRDMDDAKAITASTLLKKPSASVWNAAEMDMFDSLPDEGLLDDLERKYPENRIV